VWFKGVVVLLITMMKQAKLGLGVAAVGDKRRSGSWMLFFGLSFQNVRLGLVGNRSFHCNQSMHGTFMRVLARIGKGMLSIPS